jgi:hypothetical protein
VNDSTFMPLLLSKLKRWRGVALYGGIVGAISTCRRDAAFRTCAGEIKRREHPRKTTAGARHAYHLLLLLLLRAPLPCAATFLSACFCLPCFTARGGNACFGGTRRRAPVTSLRHAPVRFPGGGVGGTGDAGGAMDVGRLSRRTTDGYRLVAVRAGWNAGVRQMERCRAYYAISTLTVRCADPYGHQGMWWAGAADLGALCSFNASPPL